MIINPKDQSMSLLKYFDPIKRMGGPIRRKATIGGRMNRPWNDLSSGVICGFFTKRMRLISFFLMASGLNAIAQTESTFLIRGRVIDATDGSAIGSANVFIENHDHIGAATDQRGYFALRIPTFIFDDYLVVSALGYTRKRMSVELLKRNSETVFEMDRMSILLNDVVVIGNRYDIEAICKEAVRRIPGNYPHKTHYINGFYRRVSTDSTQYTGLVEAIVGIIDPGYKNSSEDVRIQVYQSRCGDNALKIDALGEKVGNEISEQNSVSSAKSLHRFYESNLIRMYSKPFTVFNEQGMAFAFQKENNGITEKAELQGTTVYNGDTILHILVTSNASEEQLDAIELSINLSDMAIVEFTRGIFDDKVNVKFVKNDDGRYYPNMIRLITPTLFESSKNRYFDIEILRVDIIKNTPKSIPKINQGLDRMGSFRPEGFSYDAVFWTQYFNDHALYIDLDNDVLRSLERFRPLEQQYKNKAFKSQ